MIKMTHVGSSHLLDALLCARHCAKGFACMISLDSLQELHKPPFYRRERMLREIKKPIISNCLLIN
jgi:hypothetical protein